MKLLLNTTIAFVIFSVTCVTKATPVQEVAEMVQSTPQSPEPAILLLFGAGIMGLTGVIRKRKN